MFNTSDVDDPEDLFSVAELQTIFAATSPKTLSDITN